MEKSTKNILMGLVKSIRWGLTSILIPYATFSYFKEYEALGGIKIVMPDEVYTSIIFWITAIGLITVSIAFAVGSSPKRSKRRAIFGMILTSSKLFYLWMYKFSGAVDFAFIIQGLGIFTVDISLMLQLWLGTIFLRYALDIYDLIDAIIYNKKQKKKKREKDEGLVGQQDFANQMDSITKEEDLAQDKMEFRSDMEV